MHIYIYIYIYIIYIYTYIGLSQDERGIILTTEMSWIRKISGTSGLQKIRNGDIRQALGIQTIYYINEEDSDDLETLRSLLMAHPFKFHISLKPFLFGRDWSTLAGLIQCSFCRNCDIMAALPLFVYNADLLRSLNVCASELRRATSFRPVSSLPGRRALRPSATCQLLVPRAKTATRQRRAFSIVGPSTWNGLPLEIRILPKNNESAFCRLLKTDLYRRGWAGGASE